LHFYLTYYLCVCHCAEVNILKIGFDAFEIRNRGCVTYNMYKVFPASSFRRDHRVILPSWGSFSFEIRRRQIRSRPIGYSTHRFGSNRISLDLSPPFRVHSSLTSSTMCVESSTTLFSASMLSRLRKRTRSAGSVRPVGSSHNQTRGFPARPRRHQSVVSFRQIAGQVFACGHPQVHLSEKRFHYLSTILPS